MVKILQAFNFAGQNTFPLNGEILSATLISENRVAISSAEHSIEIYNIGGSKNVAAASASASATAAESGVPDVGFGSIAGPDENSPAKYCLPTVGEVVKLIYCRAGKYLLTLEKESVSSPIKTKSSAINCTSSGSSSSVITSNDDAKMFVRVYENFWKFPEADLAEMPLAIRIASMTTPKSPLVENIDVIELPLRCSPDIIQCCQTSGNVIVACKDRLYLHEYAQCIHENTQPRFCYVDFLPFKLFVSLSFIPAQVCLSENVIACMNNRYCVVFKIVDGSSAASHAYDNGGFDDDGGGGGCCGGGGGGVFSDPDGVGPGNYSSESDITSGTSANGGPSTQASFETDSFESLTIGPTAKKDAGGGLRGRTHVDFNVARLVNSACGREFAADLKSEWDETDGGPSGGGGGGSASGVCGGVAGDSQEIIITPTRTNEIKIKLVNEAKAMNVQRISSNGNITALSEEGSAQYDIRKLLQICMRTSDTNGRIVDILRCMDLKAIYQRPPFDDDDDDDSPNDELNEGFDSGGGGVGVGVGGLRRIHRPYNRRTLKSHRHQNCIGYALLVASSVDGYLYQFSAQGKWYNENEKPVAIYTFTAPVLNVHIDDFVIYGITTDSVEVHTSRIGHKLFNNRFEYPTLGDLFAEESSADVNTPIVVIGLYSFMCVQFVCMNERNLVLISNSSTTDQSGCCGRSGGGTVELAKRRSIAARLLAEAKTKNPMMRSQSGSQTAASAAVQKWTLYNLEVPLIESIIDDVEHYADTFRAASGSNFFDLMEEAHIMLRLSLTLNVRHIGADRETLLRGKFVENCRKLAEFAIRSEQKEVYLQATGFYKMCGSRLPEIYADFIAMLNEDDDMEKEQEVIGLSPADGVAFDKRRSEHFYPLNKLIGFIYTVKQLLLGIGVDRSRATFLHQSVSPFFTPLRVVDPGIRDVPLALEFLNLFVKYSPGDVAAIMLASPLVADAVNVELINYLRYLDGLGAEENLLLAVTACRVSNYMLAGEVVAKTDRRQLAMALIKHKNVLFDDGTVLYQRQQRSGGDHHHNTRKSPASARNSKWHSHRYKSSVRIGGERPTDGGGADNASSTIISFSEFTEIILLTNEQPELIEAISDAFIHALCIEHSIGLESIIQLFLNYIASHIGHKGYQSSQKVFINILQVYFYDLLDVNPVSGGHHILRNLATPMGEANGDGDGVGVGVGGTSSPRMPPSQQNSDERDDSLGNSICESINSNSNSSLSDERGGSSNSIDGGGGDGRQSHHIAYDDFSLDDGVDDDDLCRSSNQSEAAVQLKGLKILFRMYMGRLKALNDLQIECQSADVEQDRSASDKFLSLRVECINILLRHLKDMRIQQEQQQLQQQRHSKSSQPQPNYYYAPANNAAATADGMAGDGSHLRHDNDGHRRKLIFVPFIPDYRLTGVEYERHIKSYIRPIPCLLDRPQYLNRLPPFKREDFRLPKTEEGESVTQFIGWDNDLLTLTLKIQSLLASPFINREVVEEFVAFIQKFPTLIGTDSFLIIVLPKHLAINYMISFSPKHLWHYGKSNNFSAKHWESLLRKLVVKKDFLPNWKSYISDILNNLVAELTFEELLQCYPSEVIPNRSPDILDDQYVVDNLKKRLFAEAANMNDDGDGGDGSNDSGAGDDGKGAKEKRNRNVSTSNIGRGRNHLPMDNIDEDNVFELALRKAVAKQRSIALRSMIESTGMQLFEAANISMYNL